MYIELWSWNINSLKLVMKWRSTKTTQWLASETESTMNSLGWRHGIISASIRARHCYQAQVMRGVVTIHHQTRRPLYHVNPASISYLTAVSQKCDSIFLILALLLAVISFTDAYHLSLEFQASVDSEWSQRQYTQTVVTTMTAWRQRQTFQTPIKLSSQNRKWQSRVLTESDQSDQLTLQHHAAQPVDHSTIMVHKNTKHKVHESLSMQQILLCHVEHSPRFSQRHYCVTTFFSESP